MSDYIDIHARKKHIDIIKKFGNFLIQNADKFSSVVVISVQNLNDGSAKAKILSQVPYYECLGATTMAFQTQLLVDEKDDGEDDPVLEYE